MRPTASLAAAITLAAVLVALGPPIGRAGEAQDRLFAVGALDGVATGQRLVFRRSRSGSFDPRRLPLVAEGEIEVALTEADDGRVALVTLREGTEVRSVVEFPAGAGNPVLLIFLETVVRDLAALTGGSPFYLRNRMREALAGDGTPVEVAPDGVTGTRLSFRPFEDDRHRDKLGPLADLELRIEVSPGVPGRFARLEAVAGAGDRPALAETVVFAGVEAK